MTAHNNYSRLDKLLHHIALRNLELQKSLADIEDRLYGARLSMIPVEQPVFITSLPRAGTTLLLEVINTSRKFATHIYRDMPFVLSPLIWNSISRGFRREQVLRERAHGDGMLVGFDSPEAFEEVLWKAFWPGNYHRTHIELWQSSDRDEEFESALTNHMKKIMSLRTTASSRGLRYLSKNNANIARLDLLTTLFPDCKILVPFRNPLDHVGALARQHANFLNLHAQDGFALRYMEWIGHYEFGKAIRPIAFAGTVPADVGSERFWLDYWSLGFAAILEHSCTNLVLIDYDGLCNEPESHLARIADAIGIDRSDLVSQRERFRPATRYGNGTLRELLDGHPDCKTIHRRLCERTV